MGNLNLDLEESTKSSEGSGSGEQNLVEGQQTATKREIIKFSNESIMHGYGMAVELLVLHKQDEAVKILLENEAFIRFQLETSLESRALNLDGN